MAVSKNQPPDRVAEAAAAGLTLFGENRIQEAKVKIPLCPGRLEWQFIGHLQSNKARDAVALFHGVQGVDSLPLAYAVDPERVRPVFRRLRELRDRCADLLGAPLPVLSMGMSGDLEVAIEEGATMVRVGTALFGERPRKSETDEPAGE
ncbi:MAG: hypothetical protein EBU81_04795 [Proteobacteria bacterium]|nr:hypothetical protein [Pseudomonadota bacterium]